MSAEVYEMLRLHIALRTVVQSMKQLGGPTGVEGMALSRHASRKLSRVLATISSAVAILGAMRRRLNERLQASSNPGARVDRIAAAAGAIWLQKTLRAPLREKRQ